MPAAMRNSGAEITITDIAAFEKSSKLVLPEDYKKFLRQYNGGRPTSKFFNIEGFARNPYGQIQDFFGNGDSVKSCDLLWSRRTFRSRVPRELLPIACEDGDSLICSNVAGDDLG